jgi:uncharacterized protein DUF3592
MPGPRPHFALRALGVVVRAAVVGAIWLLAAAMFVTGLVLWRDWHALAREGVDHQAVIERCEWESMHRQKLMIGRGSGYYSCHYVYRGAPSGPAYAGYFQSQREWKTGEAIAIRYRRDRPDVSATVGNLAHPSVVPGALMALPLLYAAWELRGPVARRLRARRAG